jgi:predicted nucleotidyltransferase component of viral defense system
MIPDIYIEQWRAIAPWKFLPMVEQDLIISRALVDLFNHPIVQQSLVFRGGTALNKLYIDPPARYSEDIDLVQIKPEPIGKTLDAIREVLDHWLGEPQRKLTERSAKLVYRYIACDDTPSKLKIEINTTEHFNVKPIIAKCHQVDSEWFQGKALLQTYHLDELMGTKLRALYQRRKGRDLFDLWYVLEKDLIHVNEVIKIFNQYSRHNDELISQAMFEQNLLLKKQHSDFRSDMLPLLTEEVQWDFEKAIALVEQRIISKISSNKI